VPTPTERHTTPRERGRVTFCIIELNLNMCSTLLFKLHAQITQIDGGRGGVSLSLGAKEFPLRPNRCASAPGLARSRESRLTNSSLKFVAFCAESSIYTHALCNFGPFPAACIHICTESLIPNGLSGITSINELLRSKIMCTPGCGSHCCLSTGEANAQKLVRLTLRASH
jgi:hypothetical protein